LDSLNIGKFMGIEVALGLFAGAASTIALLIWRRNRRIVRRLANLAAKCDQAESDKASLIRTFSIRNSEEDERFSRLEHDVKSSLGVILGFSSLLRELVEQNPGTAPLPLKSINGIHQAATKILGTIDAAAKNRNSRDSQTIMVDGKI
jgi:signal transduction histidine kinase